jgi:hypothetical protein
VPTTAVHDVVPAAQQCFTLLYGHVPHGEAKLFDMHGNRVTAISECFHDGFATGDPILLVVADDVCCVNPLLPVPVAPNLFEGDRSEHNHRGILALAGGTVAHSS